MTGLTLLGNGDKTAAAGAVLSVCLDLATHVVERLRAEPVDVVVDRRVSAAETFSFLSVAI